VARMTIFAIALLAPSLAFAQTPDPDFAADCNNITPRGGGRSDHKAINHCLCTQFIARLAPGTFLLKQPIRFPRKVRVPDPTNCTFATKPQATLTGAGAQSIVTVVPGCLFPADPNNAAIISPLIDDQGPAQASTITNLTIDASNLQQGCTPALEGFIIRVENVDSVEIGGMNVHGALGGGAATAGGVQVLNAPLGANIHDNQVTDLGYAAGASGQSAGNAGIQVGNSANSRVLNNTVRHVSFGIEVSNYVGSGYSGDSSGTTLSGNKVFGTSHLTNCGSGATCIGGRAYKLQTFVTPDGATFAPTLRNLTVSQNLACDFGGMIQNGSLVSNTSGLDIIGVQSSTFSGNTIDSLGASGKCNTSASAAEFGLQLRPVLLDNKGVPASPLVPTQGNTFTGNYFRSGCGGPGCTSTCNQLCGGSGCSDVNFNATINGNASQNGISPGNKGSNDFRCCRP